MHVYLDFYIYLNKMQRVNASNSKCSKNGKCGGSSNPSPNLKVAPRAKSTLKVDSSQLAKLRAQVYASLKHAEESKKISERISNKKSRSKNKVVPTQNRASTNKPSTNKASAKLASTNTTASTKIPSTNRVAPATTNRTRKLAWENSRKLKNHIYN